ncbi:general transcription factor IIH subunit 5 isoform X1 [Cervus elaphus]|uniref:general transcription factor IIH subunit 5 isoform X1 n=1 Tax=Cervus elaphus TaxID=9860 RepID=UPI001CC2798C|nr:general transcription factor IIH subunit 5 isoform X1 [Cervus elaphus]
MVGENFLFVGIHLCRCLPASHQKFPEWSQPQQLLKQAAHAQLVFASDCSDPAMKQFLLYLDESNALGKKFIIQDIDDTHVFVIAELVNVLQERVGELMDQNAFSLTQK